MRVPCKNGHHRVRVGRRRWRRRLRFAGVGGEDAACTHGAGAERGGCDLIKKQTNANQR